MGAFYHAFGVSIFHSRVFDIDSGSSQNFGHDPGCEGSAFVSNDCLRDVDVLSENLEYLHKGVHYTFSVWFAGRDSEHIMREVIARRQDVRIPI